MQPCNDLFNTTTTWSSVKKKIPDDENRRGILSKAKGQCARLAGVIYVLEQAVTALQASQNGVEIDSSIILQEWQHEISAEAVERAEVLADHFINQKFCLMPPEIVVCSSPLCTASQSSLTLPELLNTKDLLASNQRVLKRFLVDNSPQLSASDAFRRRLQPTKPLSTQSPQRKNKYPVEMAKEFMKAVAEAGFGEAEEVRSAAAKKSSFVFRKRNFDELDAPQREVLKYLRISQDEYSRHQPQDHSDPNTPRCASPQIEE